MFDHTHYSRRWIAAAQKGFLPNNGATKYGVTVEKATRDVKWHWRVIGVHHLEGIENMGNHHAYVDVLDQHGNRINGAQVNFSWIGQRSNERPAPITIDKPPNEPGGNYAINKGQVMAFWVNDPFYPSDVVSGISIQHNDEGTGNTWGHHSFYVVWQRIENKKQPAPIVSPPEQPQYDWRDFSGQAASDGGDILLRIPRDVVAPEQTRIIRWPEVA